MKTVKDQGGKAVPKELLRSPIVVVLGHVDHGKTTLLDKIRDTNIQQKEAGGITQGIGASVVTTKGKKRITFIDTPGHAAFANMRSQGARVADLAILVVAADSGVKPQTKEALQHILKADIPFIVAATKVDLKKATPEAVRGQLEKEGVVFEGKGGDVPFLDISGKTGKGIGELLEMIALLSELSEIKGSPDADLEAVVIETSKDRKGPVATVVMRNGTLKVRDDVVTTNTFARIRALFNYQGKSVKQVGPGEPVQILGFAKLPQVGEKIWHKKDGKAMLQVSESKLIQKEIEKDQLLIVLKVKNTSSLESLLSNLPDKVSAVESGVGNVTESDVFLAKSAGADIFAFESKVPNSVAKLALTEGVKLFSFNVIYELFENLESLVKESKESFLGRAEIIKVFPFNNKRVAGSKIVEGRILKRDRAVVKRGDEMLGEVRIISMKKKKMDVEKVEQGEQCGIIFSPQLEFEVGDVILSLRE